jgi:hypothetical protein
LLGFDTVRGKSSRFAVVRFVARFAGALVVFLAAILDLPVSGFSLQSHDSD